MMTRAELAFSALDKNKKGYITAKELMKLTKKLSKEELMSLMAKVYLWWSALFRNFSQMLQFSLLYRLPIPCRDFLSPLQEQILVSLLFSQETSRLNNKLPL